MACVSYQLRPEPNSIKDNPKELLHRFIAQVALSTRLDKLFV
jgi:hypothetical protein